MTMEEELVKKNIAKNMIAYRKRCNLTQSQLAEKIAYSDKAVSKWERAEGVPDLIVLLKLCDIFGVTLNDMISSKVKRQAPYFLRNRWIITALSSLLVWLIAVFCFVIGRLIDPTQPYLWMTFIYAIPVTFIVLVVFSCLWAKKWIRFITITGLVWSICLGVYLPLQLFVENGSSMWMIFLIGIPLQVLLVFWFLLKKKQKEL